MAEENDFQNEDEATPDSIGVTEEEAKRLLSEDAVDSNDSDTSLDDDEDPEGAEHLGDPGKKALARMKEERRAARMAERQVRKELAALQAKLKEYEDAKLSESERLQKDRDGFKARAEKAEAELTRLRIALETAPEGPIDPAVLRKVIKRMSGDSEDALIEDAEELWADFAPAVTKASIPSKPKEKLRGGVDPENEPDEMNPAKLAALIPRAR